MFRRLTFNFMYWFGKPRWDTNITPPELVNLIEKQNTKPGRALDLGCGTGTNAIYLAQHGWESVGVDFVGKAINTAKGKAKKADVNVEFFQGDVTQLDFLNPPFDLILDIGCFHSIATDRRSAYINSARRLLTSGGIFLCYAFKPEARLGGLAPEEMIKVFQDGFVNTKIEHGEGMPSAWYWFKRI